MENAETVQDKMCIIKGCQRIHCGRRKMCDIHYRKEVKYGDPLAGKFFNGALKLSYTEAVKAYLLEKIKREDNGCWTWTGCKNEWGYGTCRIENKTFLAHRISAYAFLGFNLSSGLLICHHCDTTACVNPEHLFVGTDADNAKDKVEKGRLNPVRGERVNTAKHNVETVRKVRRMFSDGMSRVDIATTLGIDRGTVGDIVTRRSWKHIPA